MSFFRRLDVESGKRILIDLSGKEAYQACEHAGGSWLMELRELGSDGPFSPGAEIVAAPNAELAKELFVQWDQALNFGNSRYEIKEPIQQIDLRDVAPPLRILAQP